MIHQHSVPLHLHLIVQHSPMMNANHNLPIVNPGNAKSSSTSHPHTPNPPPYGQAYPGGPSSYPNGPYYPGYPPPPQVYNQVGSQVAPPHPQPNPEDFVLATNWQKFALNQPVQVNIYGRGWLMGTVVAIINIVKAISGSHLKVRYVDVSQEAHEDVFPNDPNYVRPYYQ